MQRLIIVFALEVLNMKGLIYLFILFMLFSTNAFAMIQTGTIQAGTIQGAIVDAIASTNALLLETGDHLLHENNDTMKLEP